MRYPGAGALRRRPHLSYAGGEVRIHPLPLAQPLETVRGVTLFQLAQSAPERLELRLQIAAMANADTVWREAEAGMRKVLAAMGLDTLLSSAAANRLNRDAAESFGRSSP